MPMSGQAFVALDNLGEFGALPRASAWQCAEQQESWVAGRAWERHSVQQAAAGAGGRSVCSTNGAATTAPDRQSCSRDVHAPELVAACELLGELVAIPSPASYVTYHVIVNVICHGIADRLVARRGKPASLSPVLIAALVTRRRFVDPRG